MYTASVKVIIPNELGMHAKPTMAFTECAARYRCTVLLVRLDNGQRVDGKSMLGVLTLALTQGTEIRIEAEGEDAIECVHTLAMLVRGL